MEESKEAAFSFNIVSGGFDFAIEPKAEELSYPFQRIWKGEKLPLVYLCDEKELTEKQKKEGLVITDFQIEPSNMQKYFRIDRNNNLQLKGGCVWLFPIPEEIKVLMYGEYERYNTLQNFSYEHVFMVKDVPIWVKIVAYVFIGLIILWSIMCLCKKKFSGFYIGRMQAELTGKRGGITREIKVKRLKQSLVPFYHSARLVYKESAGIGDPYIRSFNMKFIRDTSGDGWEIVNYGDFSDSKRYGIGKRPVTEGNRTFSKKNPFYILDKNGNEKILVLHEKED